MVATGGVRVSGKAGEVPALRRACLPAGRRTARRDRALCGVPETAGGDRRRDAGPGRAAARAREGADIAWTEQDVRRFLWRVPYLRRRAEMLADRIAAIEAMGLPRSARLGETASAAGGTSDPTYAVVARWVDELPSYRAELAEIRLQLGQLDGALASLTETHRADIHLRYFERVRPLSRVWRSLHLSRSAEARVHAEALRMIATMMK